MKAMLWALDKMFGRNITDKTQEHLAELADSQVRASREQSASLLKRLASERGSHVLIGKSEWGEPVSLPLEFLVKAHSFVTGGSGSGKSMAAALLIEAMLEAPEPVISFAVLDAKGELFERALYLIARRIKELPDSQAEALARKVCIIDLACPDPVSPYNIAKLWPGSDLDYFSHSRVETLQELLPSGDGFSLRGGSIVKNVIKLLAERELPFSFFDQVLSEERYRARLLEECTDDDIHSYFRHQFPSESRATVAAVRARLASTLLGSESLKLALSGQNAPDFRALQDGGNIVLINCAGPNISRTTARTLQALLLSDIRQSIFNRRNQIPFLWVLDEAQNFLRTRQLRENMSDALTMSRSFNSFFLCLTQNLSTAVQDTEVLETIFTNIRWCFAMRGTPHDAKFLEPAFPVTGRMQKPRPNPYAPPEFYSIAEERALRLKNIASLPDRVGWLWLKALTGEAMKIKTHLLELPQGEEFRHAVARIRGDSRIGNRIAREDYLAQIATLNDRYGREEQPNTLDQLKKTYQEELEVVQ